LEETLERSEASASFVELAQISDEQRYSLKNAAVLMIVMLGCSELDTVVSDVGIKTMESDNCREILINNKNANGMLAVI